MPCWTTPPVDAKFDNDFIIRHHIGPAQVDVLSRINLNSAGRIFTSTTTSPSSTVSQYYKLPSLHRGRS